MYLKRFLIFLRLMGCDSGSLIRGRGRVEVIERKPNFREFPHFYAIHSTFVLVEVFINNQLYGKSIGRHGGL
jgi:hypothetical protein